MSITEDNRKESYEKVNKQKLYSMIISTLKEYGNLTAREVAVILHDKGLIISNERQATAPRLTELVEVDKVRVVGKKYDNVTMRNVAVYSIA